jgi:hypothetical integral membrane protein (TIGR02206 family)
MYFFIDPNVRLIKLFGIEHLFYLSVMISAFLFIWINRKQLHRNQKNIRTTLIIVSIFQQILLYTYFAFMTNFDLSQALPLHLCRISTILGLLYLFTRKSFWMDLVFYFGLFSYASFLYPLSIQPPYHALGLSFLLNHMLTLLLPFIAWNAFAWRPSKTSLKWVFLSFLIYLFLAALANKLFGGNYFYLAQRPFLNTLSVYMYYPLVVVVTLTGFYLAYLFTHYLSKRYSSK